MPNANRRRRARRIAAAITAALIVGPPLFMAVATPPRPDIPPPDITGPGPFRVYVADWGYHTSIIVEQPPGLRLGPPGEEDAPYVEYAWGDRRFYMESNYWPHSVFATLLLPTASVAYLDGRPAPPEASGGARVVLVREVSVGELRALVAELERSMLRGAGGDRPPPYPPARGYAGRFYPGHGYYIFWSDCNAWTVARLRAAGLAGSPAGVVFSGQVAGRLRGFRPAGAGR